MAAARTHRFDRRPAGAAGQRRPLHRRGRRHAVGGSRAAVAIRLVAARVRRAGATRRRDANRAARAQGVVLRGAAAPVSLIAGRALGPADRDASTAVVSSAAAQTSSPWTTGRRDRAVAVLDRRSPGARRRRAGAGRRDATSRSSRSPMRRLPAAARAADGGSAGADAAGRAGRDRRGADAHGRALGRRLATATPSRCPRPAASRLSADPRRAS